MLARRGCRVDDAQEGPAGRCDVCGGQVPKGQACGATPRHTRSLACQCRARKRSASRDLHAIDLCWRLLRSSEPLYAPTFSSSPPQTRSVCLVRAASVHGPLPRVLPSSSQVSQGGRFLLRAALARPHFNLPVRAHVTYCAPLARCAAHALPGRAAFPVTTLNRNTAVRPYQNMSTSERSLTDRGL